MILSWWVLRVTQLSSTNKQVFLSGSIQLISPQVSLKQIADNFYNFYIKNVLSP